MAALRLPADAATIQHRQDFPVQNVVQVRRLSCRIGERWPALWLPHASLCAARITCNRVMTVTGALDLRVLGSLVNPSQTERLTMIESPSLSSQRKPRNSDLRRPAKAATAHAVAAGSGKTANIVSTSRRL